MFRAWSVGGVSKHRCPVSPVRAHRPLGHQNRLTGQAVVVVQVARVMGGASGAKASSSGCRRLTISTIGTVSKRWSGRSNTVRSVQPARAAHCSALFVRSVARRVRLRPFAVRQDHDLHPVARPRMTDERAAGSRASSSGWATTQITFRWAASAIAERLQDLVADAVQAFPVHQRRGIARQRVGLHERPGSASRIALRPPRRQGRRWSRRRAPPAGPPSVPGTASVRESRRACRGPALRSPGCRSSS